MPKFSNCVRFIVQAGKSDDFVAVYEQNKLEAPGLERNFIIQTGDREFVGVGIWESKESLVAGRPTLIAFLDLLRPLLEEISPELGVTDPRSGYIRWDTHQD